MSQRPGWPVRRALLPLDREQLERECLLPPGLKLRDLQALPWLLGRLNRPERLEGPRDLRGHVNASPGWLGALLLASAVLMFLFGGC